MKIKIWLVTGSTGEYSDRMEWTVCAYFSEKLAKEHAENAQAKANLLRQQYLHPWDIPKGANEFDPTSFSMDYTGTRYEWSMVELADAPLSLAAWLKIQQ